MTVDRVLIDQKNIASTRMDTVDAQPLAPGQARLKLDSFALTSNNVTYALAGFDIGYWAFFPSGVDGQGLLPVWGVAEVVESQSDDLAIGMRLYGFYPLASELVITPKADAHGAITDAAPHRADLPAVYNRYNPVPAGDANRDYVRALLQPLLATSYLLFDWLADNDQFGAKQIVIGSASSKTGLGLCKFLAELNGRDFKIVGLTSKGNKGFVEGLGACDQVLTYDEIEQLEQVPSVYVDMAGNGEVKAALHNHLRDNIKHSAAVGISHWDKFNPKQSLPGAKPQFFFAPAQIAKRREDWGPGVIEKQINDAIKRIAQNANDWLEVKVHSGISEAPDVYAALIGGTANPRDGHIISV